MVNKLLLSIEELTKEHKNRKHWLRVLMALAVVVVFCTTYALILPAITMEDHVYCGYEEHVHGPECYTETAVLSCGLSETGHTHGPACYETRQIMSCTEAEDPGHRHSEACYDEEGQLICQEAERPGHQHSAACYEEIKALICQETEQEAHQHTEACYSMEEQLTCRKEEHMHSAQCFSDPQADVEDPATWERSFAAVTLSGEAAADVLAMAKSQLDYQESTDNYQVDEAGEKKGYTRYGDWYGEPYEDWSAMFCAFCLHYAEIDAYPLEADCAKWLKQLKKQGYYQGPDYLPRRGDLVFFDTDLDNRADQVGFVYNANAHRLKTIEGDKENMVQYGSYSLDDEEILAYASLLPDEEASGAAGDDSDPALADEPEVILPQLELPADKAAEFPELAALAERCAAEEADSLEMAQATALYEHASSLYEYQGLEDQLSFEEYLSAAYPQVDWAAFLSQLGYPAENTAEFRPEQVYEMYDEAEQEEEPDWVAEEKQHSLTLLPEEHPSLGQLLMFSTANNHHSVSFDHSQVVSTTTVSSRGDNGYTLRLEAYVTNPDLALSSKPMLGREQLYVPSYQLVAEAGEPICLERYQAGNYCFLIDDEYVPFGVIELMREAGPCYVAFNAEGDELSANHAGKTVAAPYGLYLYRDAEASMGLIPMDGQAQLQATLSRYFELDDRAEVLVKTADCLAVDLSGKARSFGPESQLAEAQLLINDNMIAVANFDFISNWVGGDANGSHGKKLIVEIPLRATKDNLGGIAMPINGETSGLYLGGEAVEYFQSATVDVATFATVQQVVPGDPEAEFFFTTAAVVADSYNDAASSGSHLELLGENSSDSFTLGHNESNIIPDLMVGSTINITEDGAAEEYLSTVTVDGREVEPGNDGWLSLPVTPGMKVVFTARRQNTELTVSQETFGTEESEPFYISLLVLGPDGQPYIPAGYAEEADHSFCLLLADGESCTLPGIPLGASVTLTEKDHPGYEVLIKDGNVTVANGDSATFTVNSITNIQVINTTGYALPDTGANGTLPYQLGGLALIALSLFGYCHGLRRKLRKEGY